jgi:Glycosyltransferase family 92
MIYSPIHSDAFKFCDIAFNSKKYIIIAEQTPSIPVLDIVLIFETNGYPFRATVDPEGMVTVYECSLPVPMKQITLKINNAFYVFDVNIYPSFDNEILFSTLVWDEDDYLPQWIRFHTSLGVTKFILYDNVPNSTKLEKTLADYENVLIVKWPYKWGRPNGEAAQQTQQNHSIRIFESAKWIGLFDVDEYVNIQLRPFNIRTSLDSILNLTNCVYDNISSVRLNSRIFVNPEHRDERNFEFLRITTCLDFTRDARWKHFVNPRNVEIFSVHQVTRGLGSCYPPTDLIYFNHYMFLNRYTGTTGNYNHDKHIQCRDRISTHSDNTIQPFLSELLE